MLYNRLYYWLKPYLPWTLRIRARRIIARARRRIHAKTWPINETAGRRPEGWPGWPDGKEFALVLTHDIESSHGLDQCRQLMELEKSLGFRSGFNFIPEGEYRDSPALREELVRNGFEIGIHDLHHDGKLYSRRDKFSANARIINCYLKEWDAQGFRSGFMLHKLDWLCDLNIQYDASTFDTDPFEPQNDGVGTIFPFWVSRSENGHSFNSSLHEPSGYVELPYTLPQDSTLFLIFQERSPEIWLKKLDWVARHGGLAQVNVHPDYIAFGNDRPPWSYPVAFYQALLEHVKKKYGDACWYALPKEIAEWYRQQHRTRVGPARQIAFTSSVLARAATKTAWPALNGKRAAVVVYSDYLSDPRPRRAAEALAACGMEVDVIGLQEDDSEARRDRVNGVNVLCLPFQRKRHSKSTYLRLYSRFLAGSAVILTARTLRKRYHLVHVHNMPDMLVFSGLAAKLTGAKIILDLHDPMPELMMSIYNLPKNNLFVRWLTVLERWSIHFADLALTPNVAFRELFISRKCPPEKIQIVMNTPQEDIFDPSRFKVANNADGSGRQFRLMYHGFLVERHGLDLAVEAVASLRPHIPCITFDFYGKWTPYVRRIEEQIKKLGLQDQVVYKGRKSVEEIATIITGVDLGIIPNRRTPFTEINLPTRIFEYTALRKPVIVPKTRGIRDYFDETQILFFNPDDVTDLARVIQWVWEHPQETTEIVRRGHEVYLQHLWRNERLRFLALAEALLSGRGRKTV